MCAASYDLLVPGRPSVDLMFSDLPQWPELGLDLEAGGLGVCAGSSFNTPAAANRLGLRVGYIALIGNDLWSHVVRDEFEAEGLPTEFLLELGRPLPFVSVAMNLDGDRGFVTYAEADEDAEEQLRRYAREVVGATSARHVHMYADEEMGELVTLARGRGMTVSFDAGDGSGWESPIPLHELLPLADVLLANESEAMAMTGVDDLPAAIDRLASLCPCVVIKRDARGAAAVVDGELTESRAEHVSVVDTTGAGDCFNAGFLYGWLRGLPAVDSLSIANICGARAVQAFGGYRGCPSESELRVIAAGRGIRIEEEVRST